MITSIDQEEALRLHEAIKADFASCDETLLEKQLELGRKLHYMRVSQAFKRAADVTKWESYVELVMRETGVGRTRVFTLAKLGKSAIANEQIPTGMKPSVLLAAVQAIGQESKLGELLAETKDAIADMSAREATAHLKAAVAEQPEKYLKPNVTPRSRSKKRRALVPLLVKHLDALDMEQKIDSLIELETFIKEYQVTIDAPAA